VRGMVAKPQGGIIFFDVTLLALRAGYKTPTGVARVELAYALEMLRRYPDRVRFVVALQRMVRVVPTLVAKRYLHAIDLAWRNHHTRENVDTLEGLGRFIGVDPSFLIKPVRTEAARANMLLLSANMLFGAALKSLLPVALARYTRLPGQHVYVHVSGSNLPSTWINRWLARTPSVSSIFLLHDVIPLTHPEYVRAKVPQRHAAYVRRVMKLADVMVANSSFTAESLVAFAEQKGLNLPSTIVAPLGTGEVFQRREQKKQPAPPYFVFVSTIEPRKNHLLLLQVWSRLVARHGKDAPKLILIGRRGWENENVIDILERAHTSGQHVMECRYLCDEALASVIAEARATLMPSHVEGYGLPVAESLALGTPVICSDLPPFREIAGDVPEYIDPLAGRGWAKLIMQYSKIDSPQRLAQLERIRTYSPPTWAGHFQQVAQVIETLGVSTAGPTEPGPPRRPDLYVPSSSILATSDI
jgi:glycosyltransferase involved in cell wall biosynthesis